MNPSASLWSTVSLQRAAKAAAALVISIGVLVLIGWATNIGVLKSVLPNLVSMKPNTAVSFVLAGTALRLTTPPTTPKRQRVGQLCALAVALIGLVSLSQDLLGWNLGIDQMLFVEDPQSSGTLSPGRMSPLTAFCFILGGSALGLSVAQRRRILMGWLCPAEALAVLTCLVAAQVLVAYLYGAQPVVGVLPYTQMALHAAINFMLLTSGILMSRPRQGLISIVVADSVGGAVARRLLPAAIAVPLLLGGFRIVTANLGLFAPDLGTSLLAVLHTVIFAGVVLWTAHQMHRIDRQRQAALEALSRANEDLEARIQERTAKLEEANRFFQLSHELMSIVGPDGYFKQLNPAWESVLGYSQPELLARPFLSFVHPADLEITRAATVCRGANRPATAFENRYRCRDGSYRWLSWITVIVADNCLVYLTARDVTDRKQAEQRLAEQV
ncbi:MAG TPA: PAS domain S-box protein, partial [Trichocoleus sp.]